MNDTYDKHYKELYEKYKKEYFEGFEVFVQQEHIAVLNEPLKKSEYAFEVGDKHTEEFGQSDANYDVENRLLVVGRLRDNITNEYEKRALKYPKNKMYCYIKFEIPKILKEYFKIKRVPNCNKNFKEKATDFDYIEVIAREYAHKDFQKEINSFKKDKTNIDHSENG